MSEPVAVVLDRPPVAEAPRGPIRRMVAGLIRFGVGLVVVAGAAAGGYVTRDRWMPVLFPVAKDAAPESDGHRR